jgi:3-oxoadipate enol-lactonase
VKRLVLACTSSGGAGGDSYPLHQLHGLSSKQKAARLIPLLDTRCDEAWQASHPGAYSALVRRIISDMEIGADEPGREQGARHQLEARIGHDTFERLPDLTMPVLICGGRYDAISPESNLRALDRHIRRSRLAFFEGGHRFLLQDERAFEHIGAFLKGQLDSTE